MSRGSDQDAKRPIFARSHEQRSCFLFLAESMARPRALRRNSENIFLVLFVLHPFLSLCREALLARLAGGWTGVKEAFTAPSNLGAGLMWGYTGAIPLSPPHAASELLAGLCQTTCVGNWDQLDIDVGLTGHQPSPLCPTASLGHRYNLSKGAQQPRQRFHEFFAAASLASLPF